LLGLLEDGEGEEGGGLAEGGAGGVEFFVGDDVGQGRVVGVLGRAVGEGGAQGGELAAAVALGLGQVAGEARGLAGGEGLVGLEGDDSPELVAFAASLRRRGSCDVTFLHLYWPTWGRQGYWMDELQALKQSGKARAVGISVQTCWS